MMERRKKEINGNIKLGLLVGAHVVVATQAEANRVIVVKQTTK